jgi:MFS family permease
VDSHGVLTLLPILVGAALRLLARPAALRGSAAIVVSGLAVGAVQTLAPLRLERAGLGEAAIGLVFVAGMTAGVIGARVVGALADRHGPALLTICAGAVAVVCLLGLAAGPRAAGVALLALLVAAAGFWLGTLAYILGSDAAADHDADVLAPVFGLTLTAWGTGALVGPPLAGAVADGPGTAAAYVAVAVICVLLLAPIAAATRTGRRRLGTP